MADEIKNNEIDPLEGVHSPGLSKLGMILIGLNAILLLAGLGLAYLGSFPPEKVAYEENLMKEWVAVNKSLEGERLYYSLNPFNANLFGSPRSFVRMSLKLEMLDQNSFQEISDLGAETRDTVLKILNEKQSAQLRSVRGKLLLKQEIITAVNSFLEKGIVKNAYFTEFALQ